MSEPQKFGSDLCNDPTERANPEEEKKTDCQNHGTESSKSDFYTGPEPFHSEQPMKPESFSPGNSGTIPKVLDSEDRKNYCK
jgi:hypothetical protein